MSFAGFAFSWPEVLGLYVGSWVAGTLAGMVTAVLMTAVQRRGRG